VRRLTLVAVAAVCAAACGRNSLAPTSTAIPSTSPNAGQGAPRIALTKFVAFGDSITWGEDGRNDPSEPLGRVRPLVLDSPYPPILQGYLDTRYSGQYATVDDRGCPGEAAGSLPGSGSAPETADQDGCGPAAIDRFQTIVIGGGYQAVLLMEGTNDIGAADREDGSPAAITELRAMVDAAKARGVRVFLATIPPEQSNPDPVPYDRSRPDDLVQGLNNMIRGLATSERVTLVDVYNAFPPPSLYNLYGLLSRDGLHPLPAGYQLIAETFFGSIETTLELPVVTTTSLPR
jgi:lysophospholipase L1-like esterase